MMRQIVASQWLEQLRKWHRQVIGAITNKKQRITPNNRSANPTVAQSQRGEPGRYVVCDDVTKEILQISKAGFEPPAYPPVPIRELDPAKEPKKGETVDVFVNVLEEGVPTYRHIEALYLGEGLYQLLPASNYDAEDEIWEFIPGSIVRCKEALGSYHGWLPLAVEQAGSAIPRE